MNKIITFLYIVVGVINFVPVLGVMGAYPLDKLYEVGVLNDDVRLLMQHRAALFGIVGGFILFAAFVPGYRPAATVAAYVSMGSFVLLWLNSSLSNVALQKIFWVDIVAIGLLTAGVVLERCRTGGHAS